MFLGWSSMEFGPFRAKTIARRLAKNLKIKSKLGFQVKMAVFEGLRLGDLRWPNMAPSSIEFDLQTLLRCTWKTVTGVFRLEVDEIRPI